MSDMNQKLGSEDAKKEKSATVYSTENNNLGLDADHSSADDNPYSYLNNDNDRVSHNPDGEGDDSDTSEEPGHSPLMDK
jgi:hypothetical protein